MYTDYDAVPLLPQLPTLSEPDDWPFWRAKLAAAFGLSGRNVLAVVHGDWPEPAASRRISGHAPLAGEGKKVAWDWQSFTSREELEDLGRWSRSEEDMEATAWFRCDLHARHLIEESLSPDLRLVVESSRRSETAYGEWRAVHNYLRSLVTPRGLQAELDGLRQGGRTIDQHALALYTICEKYEFLRPDKKSLKPDAMERERYLLEGLSKRHAACKAAFIDDLETREAIRHDNDGAALATFDPETADERWIRIINTLWHAEEMERERQQAAAPRKGMSCTYCTKKGHVEGERHRRLREQVLTH